MRSVSSKAEKTNIAGAVEAAKTALLAGGARVRIAGKFGTKASAKANVTVGEVKEVPLAKVLEALGGISEFKNVSLESGKEVSIAAKADASYSVGGAVGAEAEAAAGAGEKIDKSGKA